MPGQAPEQREIKREILRRAADPPRDVPLLDVAESMVRILIGLVAAWVGTLVLAFGVEFLLLDLFGIPSGWLSSFDYPPEQRAGPWWCAGGKVGLILIGMGLWSLAALALRFLPWAVRLGLGPLLLTYEMIALNGSRGDLLKASLFTVPLTALLVGLPRTWPAGRVLGGAVGGGALTAVIWVVADTLPC